MSDATLKGPEGRADVVRLEGVTPLELYAAGAQCLKARDYPSARACLEKYLEQRPDDPAALHLIARILYHQNKDFDKAEEYLNKAISLNPGSLTGYLETLGTLLIHQGKYVRAREILEYALSEDKKENARHTAAIKFYLDLAKKKGGDHRPRPPKPYKPRSVVFTAEYGHRRMRAPLFILPSIVAHALMLLLIMYLSAHQLPFHKDSADFTFVELEQPAENAPPQAMAKPAAKNPQAAPEVVPPAQPVPSQTGERLKLPTVPAKVSPRVKPKIAAARMENLPATAPEKREKEGGGRGAVSAKNAFVPAMKRQEAAVNMMPGRKERDMEAIRPELSRDNVRLSKKDLAALSGGAKAAAEKRYKAAKLTYKAPSARTSISQSRAAAGGPSWTRGRLAEIEGRDSDVAREKLASGKYMGMANPAARALTEDDVKNFAARPLNIDTGNSRAANSGTTPDVRPLSDMADEVPVYDKMQEGLGVPMPSSGGFSGMALSKAPANVGLAAVNDQPRVLPENYKMAASMRLAAGRYSSMNALPGKKALKMPGWNAAGAMTSRAEVARLDKKSFSAQAGFASPGIAARGGGAYAGTAKGSAGKALSQPRSASGLGGLLESASMKMASALGLAQPEGPSAPSAADLKRDWVPARPAPADARGFGAPAQGARQQASWSPANAPGGGMRRFGAGSLSPVENSYALASRAGEAPGLADRFSSVATRSRLLSENVAAPKVRIVSPSAGNTDRISQTVTGMVSDARIRKATLTVNNDSRVISVQDGRFEASVSLLKGRNVVTVMAFDTDGNVGRDSIHLLYSEPSDRIPVNIVSPRNGQVFDVSENNLITVTGTVGDPGIKRAKLIFNGYPMDIVVDKGSFEQKVVLTEEQNTIMVEAADRRGVSDSRTVEVGAANAKPKDIMVVLSWDKPHADFDLGVYGPSGEAGKLEEDSRGNFGPEVFGQEHAERGIYTVKANYSGGDGDERAKVTVILYGDNPARKIVRVFGPHLRKGANTWEVTRFKMPEGIFLEE